MGRNGLRLSLAPLMKLYYQNQFSINQYRNRNRMKIRNSNRFVRSIFYEQSDTLDEYYEPARTCNEPFREIGNAQISNSTRASKENNLNSTFLGQFMEENVQLKADQITKNRQKQTIKNVSLREQIRIPKISKLLLDFESQEESEQSNESVKNSDSFDLKKSQRAQELKNIQNLDLPKFIEDNTESEKQIKQYLNFSEINNFLQSQKQQQTVQEKKIPLQKKNTKENVFQSLGEDNKGKFLLRRDKQNLEGNLQYNIYLQATLMHILTVRKEGLWQYCFYLRENKVGGLYNYIKIARMESTFLSNTFTLLKQNENNSQMTVHYQTNLLGLSGPRKMDIFLPKTIIPSEYLQDLYNDTKWKGQIQKFTSKSAKWNQKVKSYVLNLHGRASLSSIKNFVITDEQESQDKSFVIFGKAGPDVYNLDICGPFSIIQGVAAAITSFERKIVCD